MPRLMFCLIALLLSWSVLAAPNAVDPAQALLSQARLWQSLGKPAPAQEALDKLKRMAPGKSEVNAEALTIQALVQLGSNQTKQADQTLLLLRKNYPSYPGVARVEQLRRVLGSDNHKLQAARLLIRSRKIDQAYVALQDLYRGPPPDGPLAVEYWELVIRTSEKGWQSGRKALQQLVAQNPGNRSYKLALAGIYLYRPPVPSTVLADIQNLVTYPDSKGQALGLWRRALLQEGVNYPLETYTAYLREAQDDALVMTKVAQLSELRGKQRALLADAGYRGRLAAARQLDRNQLTEAESSLKLAQRSYGQEADVLGNLGRLREKQGRYAEAISYYQQALRKGGDKATWRRLIAQARLGQWLAQADRAIKDGNLTDAASALAQARKQQPASVDVMLLTASLQARQGQTASADRLYRQVLRREPGNGTALAGVMEGYLAQGQYQAASRYLQSLPGKQRKALGKTYYQAVAQIERSQGDKLLAAGFTSEAVESLQRAVDAQPDDPWNRFALANALLASGDAAQGGALLRKLAEAPKPSADSKFAYALYRSKTDDAAGALRTLEQIAPAERSEGMAQLQRRVWLNETLRLADAEAASGKPQLARQRLAAAEAQLAGDGARLNQLARGWIKLGEVDHARMIMLAQYQKKPDADTALDYADLLLEQNDLTAVSPVLAAVPAAGLSVEQQLRREELQTTLVLRQVEELRSNGRDADARNLLQSALATDSKQPRLLGSLAEDDLGRQDWASAREHLQQALAQKPDDAELKLQLVDVDLRSGETSAARIGLETLLAGSGQDVDYRLRLLSRLNDLGDHVQVDLEVARLLTNDKNKRSVAQFMARQSRANHQSDRALAWYRASFAPEPAASPEIRQPTLPVKGNYWWMPAEARVGSEVRSPRPDPVLQAQPLQAVKAETPAEESRREDYSELLDKRTPSFQQGLDVGIGSGGTGTPGQSRLTMLQSFTVVELPAQQEGRYFLRSDQALQDAGSLQPDDGYARQSFGAVASCNDQVKCARDAGRQRAAGVSLGVGYENEKWRIDLGTTPLGFPIQSVVGGVKYSDSVGSLNYSIDASRRAVTSSLLSYAGTSTPYYNASTGQTTRVQWGGVRSSGVSVGLGYDKGGAFGVWSDFAWHQLTGENVARNERATAMAGVYWRLLKDPSQVLTVGLNSINFWYQKDLSGYTLGQGGYYSPQRYNSLSLPVTYSARNERWSYTLRGGVSVSNARVEPSPFFPLDSDLQDRKKLSSDRSSDVSIGASLSAAMEYRLTPKLAVGGMVEYQHSQFYQPLRGLVYLRYQPAPATSLPPLPVEPVRPYSTF